MRHTFILVALGAALAAALFVGRAEGKYVDGRWEPNVSPAQLVVQLDRANARRWAKPLLEAEDEYGLPRGLLLAVASRETSVSNIVGDNGHGRGLFQIDDRYHERWLRSVRSYAAGRTPPVRAAARYAARILRAHHDRALKAGVPAYRAWKFAMSAYNAGYTGALNGYQQGDSDVFTAGRDYGKDVRWRRQVFSRLIDYERQEPNKGRVRRPEVQLDARSLVADHGSHAPQRAVLHSTESPERDGVSDLYGIAAYWQQAGLGIGSQLGVDCAGNTARYVDDNKVGWHTARYNTGSLGIEQVGYAAWTRARWLQCRPMLEKVAKWLAYWSATYGIQLRRDVIYGVLTHADATRYRGIPGGHWDPGPGYPFDLVVKRARYYKANGW